MTNKSPLQIGPLIPFACSYKQGDKLHAITLYGLTEEQILNDNCDLIPSLKVDGVLWATGKWDGKPRKVL